MNGEADPVCMRGAAWHIESTFPLGFFLEINQDSSIPFSMQGPEDWRRQRPAALSLPQDADIEKAG